MNLPYLELGFAISYGMAKCHHGWRNSELPDVHDLADGPGPSSPSLYLRTETPAGQAPLGERGKFHAVLEAWTTGWQDGTIPE